MKLSNERKLVVFTYLLEKGSKSIRDIQAELEISEDENFQFEEILNELIEEGSVTPISPETEMENMEITDWEITESGKIQMKELALDKYEEINRIPYIIRAIILVVAILAFMMIFPRMFRRF